MNVVRFTPLTEVSLKEFLFQQLGFLIAIVKQHIRPYLDQILELVKEHWTVNSPFQITIIFLVEHVAMALGAEFKMYLPHLVPLILRVLTHDASKDRSVTGKLYLTFPNKDNHRLTIYCLQVNFYRQSKNLAAT